VGQGQTDGEAAGAGGSGGHAIAGYEYQIDVSVWLALDLVLANRLANELVLEPASEEDIEADLAENELGRLTSTAALNGYRLVVQAKLRSGDAWMVSSSPPSSIPRMSVEQVFLFMRPKKEKR
jgi:hypothetical protein